MDPLSIIAGVVGIVGFAASSTANLLSLIESTRGCPAAVRGTGRDASEFLAVLNNLKELLNDETLKGDETVQNVFRSLESPIRTSQAALDELVDLIERYAEPSGKVHKWNSLKWAFKDENNVKILNDRLVMSKTTLVFALTTINTLNSMRLNKTQGLISDQIRDLRLDLEVKEVSSVRPRQGSETRGTEVGFALQRFLNDTNDVFQSPIGAETWMDCNDAITSSFYDDSIFPDSITMKDRMRPAPRRSDALWIEFADTIDVDGLNEQGETLLHRAAEVGDTDLSHELLKQKAIVDVRDDTGTTPLGTAAWKGHVGAARILLENGADVNAANKDQHTPCHHAAEAGHTTVLKFLIDNGADLEAREEDGWTPLYSACTTTRLGTAKLLIEAGADITTLATEGTTCLHAAALEGSASLIGLLLDSGADIGTRDLTGATALHKAVQDDSLKATITLLERGADLEAADLEGRTPLWVTAEEPSVQCARFLLEKGARVDARNSNGETPLAAAASRGHEQVTKILLEFNTDINTKDSIDHTPLHHAVEGEQTKMVQLLIERGANIHAVNRFMLTPLHLAVDDTYSRETVSILYQNGADLNNLSVVDDTPLTTALRSDDERRQMMAIHLLELGANPDITGVSKKAPLHWAAEKGLDEVVRALLEKGADKNILDGFGSSPIHFAAKSGHVNCLRVLVDDGTDLEIADRDRYTAMWKVVMNNENEIGVEMIHVLHAAGATIEGLEKVYGKTPLVWAAENGYRLIVQALLERSANVSARDCFDMTAFHYAAENGHLEIVKNLLNKGSDLTWRTNENCTPMWKAYSKNQDETVAFLVFVGSPDSVLTLIQDHRFEEAAKLVRSGASRTVTWEDNRVTLNFAAQEGATELVQLLLDQNSIPNPRDSDGWTPLMYALHEGHLDIVKLLLDHGNDLDDYNSSDLLFIAVKGNHTKCVSFLLARGIDVNIADHEGQTALHIVCSAEKEDLEMARWLLDHGARPDLVDIASLTPKMLADAKEHDGLLRVLGVWELKNKGGAGERTASDFAKNKDLNKRRFARRDNVEFEMLGRPTW